MAKRSELAGVKKIVFLFHCRQPVHQTDICVVACRFPVGINLTCHVRLSSQISTCFNNYFMSDCRLLSGKKRAKAKDVDVDVEEKDLAKAEEGDVVRCRLMYQSLKILLREQYVVV